MGSFLYISSIYSHNASKVAINDKDATGRCCLGKKGKRTTDEGEKPSTLFYHKIIERYVGSLIIFSVFNLAVMLSSAQGKNKFKSKVLWAGLRLWKRKVTRTVLVWTIDIAKP